MSYTKSLPPWAMTAAEKEEQQDAEDGRKVYRREKAARFNAMTARQSERRIRVREIDAAQVESDDAGNYTVLGAPWFEAWLTIATFLAFEGRFQEIKPPREWLAGKVLS